MPPYLRFLVHRMISTPTKLVILTMLLYEGVMLTPPKPRFENDGPGRTPLNNGYTNFSRCSLPAFPSDRLDHLGRIHSSRAGRDSLLKVNDDVWLVKIYANGNPLTHPSFPRSSPI